jgi:PAS domain S-box-containing protein
MHPIAARQSTRRIARDLVLCTALAAAGLLMTATVYDHLRDAEKLQNFERRNALAETVVAALDRDATATLEAVRNAGLLAEMMPRMSAIEFETYARRLEQTYPALTGVQWVRFGDKPSYAFSRSPSPWTLIKPEALQAAQKRAQAAGAPAATSPFVVPATGRVALVVTMPVYERIPGVTGTNKHLGFINALVDTVELSRHANFQAKSAGTELLISDAEREGPLTPVFSGIVEPGHKAGHDEDGIHPERADHLLEVAFGGRQWQVLIHPTAVGWRTPLYNGALALVGGVALTALLTWLLARSQFNRRQKERATAQEKLLREELIAEQARLKDVVESTGVAIWEYDLHNRFLSVSERWHIVSGYTRGELGDNVLQAWQSLVHPDDFSMITTTFAELRNKPEDRFEYTYRMRQKSGAWMWVRSLAHVVERGTDGIAIKVAGINIDITLQKEAELRIQALNASLEAQMQEAVARSEARATLSTLIASVSHEMATPMGNSMMTASTLMAQAQQFDAQLGAGNLRRSDLAAFVGSVKDGNTLLVRNLERAVALLKNFRQVAADQASEQRRSFDLQHSLREVIDTLAPSLKKHSHKVLLEAEDGITLDSYPGPLGQVVINLINNAYLHAFDGRENGIVRIEAKSLGDKVSLRVSDNGQGIAPETLAKMFEPFFSTRIGQGGTGLGMSIVENLVKTTLGGTLEVQSTVGVGTVVSITLPRSAPEPQTDGASP